MAIKTSDQQRLDSIDAEHRGRYSGRREDYFAILYLTRKFKVDVDEIAHQVAFGGNDYGLMRTLLIAMPATYISFSSSGQKTRGNSGGPWNA